MDSMNEKPDCPLIGQDGNIFNLVGIASRTLRGAGQKDAAKEMSDRVFASGSYDEALCIIGEYVNITSVEEERESVMERLEDMDVMPGRESRGAPERGSER